MSIIFSVELTACNSESDGDCSKADATEKYKSAQESSGRNTAGNGKFRLTVYNPVANTGEKKKLERGLRC